MESALQQGLDSLLRFRPRQRGLKGGEGGEEAVGGRQRDLVDEILRGGDGTPVEGGDPARERVDEAVQFGVWKCPVDVSVSFRGVAVEVVRAENDFARAATADQMWKTYSLLTPRTQPRIFAMLTTGDLVRRTKVSIRIGRPEAPTAVMMFPILPVKSKWER